MSRANVARAGLAGAAPVFAALGDETRLQVVARLCKEGPLSIVDLSDVLSNATADFEPLRHSIEYMTAEEGAERPFHGLEPEHWPSRAAMAAGPGSVVSPVTGTGMGELSSSPGMPTGTGRSPASSSQLRTCRAVKP